MEMKIVEAAKSGARETVEQLLAAGGDVDEQDEHGWTALCWAAGKGDAATVELLLARGADGVRAGRDGRRPRAIARAAGHGEVAARLAAVEKERGVEEDQVVQPYLKAYLLEELRRFDRWVERSSEDGEEHDPLTDAAVVYLHQDLTVTRDIWHGDGVIFDDVSDAWREFCEQEIGFAVPEELL
ncbi:MAG: ankyrin repeat domain-containing protein [Thermoanaerobaculia bacterium]